MQHSTHSGIRVPSIVKHAISIHLNLLIFDICGLNIPTFSSLIGKWLNTIVDGLNTVLRDGWSTAGVVRFIVHDKSCVHEIRIQSPNTLENFNQEAFKPCKEERGPVRHI